MTDVVVAIGGNAILHPGEEATAENQMENLRKSCALLAQMAKKGWNLIVVHGNGPQVGNILLQNELSKTDVPAMPLDICGAQSQGQIGLMLQQAMGEALYNEEVDRNVTCLLTRVIVDLNDPEFTSPSKPIGPYYNRQEAEMHMDQGWRMKEDVARGGWRRLVPSPLPLSVLEADAVRALIDTKNQIVIAAGGGGVPMVRRNGRLCGVEAVVDKDRAASVLAKDLCDLFIILTDVDAAFLDFGGPNQRALGEVTVEELKRYYAEGNFHSGSMGPKVEAAINFVDSPDKMAIITSPELLDKALESRAGTRVVL
ncbi:MAG: carbamate kinase [Euryarchaeota archaeon]|nr:carbamate kinase [Euryarchaeota archaeon]